MTFLVSCHVLRRSYEVYKALHEGIRRLTASYRGASTGFLVVARIACCLCLLCADLYHRPSCQKTTYTRTKMGPRTRVCIRAMYKKIVTSDLQRTQLGPHTTGYRTNAGPILLLYQAIYQLQHYYGRDFKDRWNIKMKL